jgi:hypothetical protein
VVTQIDHQSIDDLRIDKEVSDYIIVLQVLMRTLFLSLGRRASDEKDNCAVGSCAKIVHKEDHSSRAGVYP